MSTPRFDLVDILQILRRHRMQILVVTLIAAVVGGIFSLVSTKKYRAKADLIIINPLYSDRSNLFRNENMGFVDHFGSDDDADRLLLMAESDSVRERVARRSGIDSAYKLDLEDANDRNELKYIFKKNFDVKRTEFNTCEFMFVDSDPNRSAKVVNETILAIDDMYRSYFVGMRLRAAGSIQSKVTELDSSIAMLTDTLAVLRDKYKIYDIVSPARKNVMSGSIQNTGVPGFGRAIEEVQNLEAIKDQLVIDRTKYVTLFNEFSGSSSGDDVRMIRVLTPAKPPVEPKGFGPVVTAIASALIAFFFCSLIILILTYYRLLISVER